jgi:FlaA1/EpsC-like NDP-sugar epimerase
MLAAQSSKRKAVGTGNVAADWPPDNDAGDEEVKRMNFRHNVAAVLWRHRRPALYLLLSAPLLAMIHLGAYWLRFEGAIDGNVWHEIGITIGWVVALKMGTFAWFRVYHGWNRYVTFYDMVVLAQASIVSSLLMVFGAYFLMPTLYVPRSVFLLDCLGTIVCLGGLRSLWRLLDEFRVSRVTPERRVRALIVGASDSAESLLRAIRRNRNLPYQIVGFISDGSPQIPARIGGLPVLGNLDDLPEIARCQQAREFLLIADEFSGKEVRAIMRAGESSGAEVKVLPSFEQLLQNRVDLRPRTVSIADLLRRDPVQLDMRGLHRWIDDRILLVTGSAGSIGSEICRQLVQFEPRRIVLVDRSENGQFYLQRELKALAPGLDLCVQVADVNDIRRMDRLMKLHRPDIIFHAAAYKHVPLMEDNPGEAVKNIVMATRSLADLAEKHEVASFVMISTDKAVNPTSVMGACKRVAEMYVQACATEARCQFVTVRFGNVLDSAGSVVPIFREQIANGGPVTVTHPDMQRYFMMIPEASQLVIQAGAMGHGGEIFVLDMGQPVRIVDLAREMIKLSGLEPGRDIEIQFTGMRPGEKLFEELHNAGELHLPTVHPKILVADAASLLPDAARAAVLQLGKLADDDPARIVQSLRQIVPLYRPAPAVPANARASLPRAA